MVTAIKGAAKRLRHAALHGYFSVRNSWPIWYGILNRSARNRQARRPIPLSAEGERIVGELRREGIATSSLEKLFPGGTVLNELHEWVASHEPVENTASKKKFLREYWDLFPATDFSNPFLRMAVSDEVLGIVNAYMGMWSRLTQYDLRKTLPMDAGPMQSQNWHRDPEEKRLIKMFVYFNDIDDDAGPFTYARKSTHDNAFGHLFPQKAPEGSYPPEEDVLREVPRDEIVAMTGKAGTVIFCDTAGLHFGGRAKMRPRIMATCGYNSPAHTEGARYDFDEHAAPGSLSPQARFALSGKKLRTGATPRH